MLRTLMMIVVRECENELVEGREGGKGKSQSVFLSVILPVWGAGDQAIRERASESENIIY